VSKPISHLSSEASPPKKRQVGFHYREEIISKQGLDSLVSKFIPNHIQMQLSKK
jgi:hypothetical protein